MATQEFSSKVCATCGVEKPAEAFPKNRTRGLRAYCKPCNNAKNKAWRDANPQKSAEMSRRWVLANPEKAKAKRLRWEAANAEWYKSLMPAWRKANPEKERANQGRARLKRRQKVIVQIHDRIGNQIRFALKSAKKSKTFDLVGYSVEELKRHLEKQFLRGMSWDNFGEWHIDHIVPVSSFVVEDEEAAKEVWALPNLRPLWAKDNLSKGPKRTHLI